MLLAHTWIHSGEPGWWDGWFQRRWVPTKEIKEEKPRNPTLFRACVFGRRALVCRGALLAKDTALKPLATPTSAPRHWLARSLRASAAGKVAEATADVDSLLE